jgi:hypothetical protein
LLASPLPLWPAPAQQNPRIPQACCTEVWVYACPTV